MGVLRGSAVPCKANTSMKALIEFLDKGILTSDRDEEHLPARDLQQNWGWGTHGLQLHYNLFVCPNSNFYFFLKVLTLT